MKQMQNETVTLNAQKDHCENTAVILFRRETYCFSVGGMI